MASHVDAQPGPLSTAPSTRWTDRRWFITIGVIALILRVAWGVAVPVVPVSDCAAYDIMARNLASGHGYGFRPGEPSAFWPVGTSFMYSLVYRIADPAAAGFGLAVALNIAIGVASVILSAMLARRWFGSRVAIVTGLLMALWPVHIQYASIIASEQVFILLSLSILLVWPGHPRRGTRDWARIALAAVLCAAATYVRPTALLFPAILIGIDVLRTWSIPIAIARGVLALAIMLALFAPWMARNHKHFGAYVLSTNGGSNFWMGNNPKTTGAYQDVPSIPGMNEAQRDRELKRQAWEYIRAEPVAFVKRTVIKAARLHERQTIGVVWNEEGLKKRGLGETAIKGLKLVSQAYWMALLLAAVVGALQLIRRRGWHGITHPAIVLWAYCTAVHAIIVYQDRYHLPITPMLAALAALAIVSLWQHLDSRRIPELRPA